QIAITGVSPVAGTNNTRFNITFALLTRTGAYTMVIGPDIQDIFGNPLDQDGDFVPDAYTAQFGIAGLKVMSSSPTGNTTLPSATTSLTLTFNEAVNLATFTASQVSLTGPNGPPPVPITAIALVSGTTYRLSASLVLTGNYHLVLSQDIQDTFGNKM